MKYFIFKKTFCFAELKYVTICVQCKWSFGLGDKIYDPLSRRYHLDRNSTWCWSLHEASTVPQGWWCGWMQCPEDWNYSQQSCLVFGKSNTGPRSHWCQHFFRAWSGKLIFQIAFIFSFLQIHFNFNTFILYSCSQIRKKNSKWIWICSIIIGMKNTLHSLLQPTV